MKQFKKLAVAIVLFMGATMFVNAQSKVAHIDTQKVLSEMPETISAQAQLKQLEETYKADLEAQFKALQNKAAQFKNEAATKTDEENLKRQQELQQDQQKIAQAEQSAGQDVQQKRAELFSPILEKLNNAIKAVAKAQGFDYVLDISALIVAEGKDIGADVKKQLGI